MEYKIAWFTEGGWTGEVPRNHPNMRNDMAWMHTLDANHHFIGNLPSMEENMYDMGIITIPKTNIEKIGYSDMNIPIYLFNYKNNLNTTYKGVMAQDLLELGLDNSVSIGHDGYYRVNYNSIDVDMEII